MAPLLKFAFLFVFLENNVQSCTKTTFTQNRILNGKLFSRWLLWNKTDLSPSQCAFFCQDDERCVSVQLDSSGRKCRGYGVCFNVNSTSESVGGYRYFQSNAARGYIGTSCEDTADCTVNGSVCVNGECMCDPGLAFSPSQRTCLSSCTTYGSEYSEIRGYYIGYNNRRTFHGVSPQQCRDKCTAETTFVCRSADRKIKDARCDIASETLKTVAASDYRIVDVDIIIHYSRDCDN